MTSRGCLFTIPPTWFVVAAFLARNAGVVMGFVGLVLRKDRRPVRSGSTWVQLESLLEGKGPRRSPLPVALVVELSVG